jgi:Na+/proline symporter/nitrogen-specific signal transduction histidine kinase
VLDGWILLVVPAAYLGLLFAVAYYGDKRADAGRSIIANPYIYTLSIAVYCTAWTFYGSVGRAASTGIGFLPIYLGPTLVVTVWWLVLRKIIRIAKVHRVTSIADFVGARYGKSAMLAGLVTIIAVVGILPYISLQLKAVATTFSVMRNQAATQAPLWSDTALYVALFLAAFTILFGTRHIDATERHEGMVAAIAFESLVKLIAFLAAGLFVTFVLFDGPADLFARAAAHPELERLTTMDALPGGAVGWFALTLLSMTAIMFLPRQFQVTVVENVNEEHLRTTLWLFPLYLLVINLFVIPIAFAGHLLLPAGTDPDTFVLNLPLTQGRELLALFVFIGGLSAATGMVIVETIALSTMVCNDLVMPVLLRIRALRLTARRDLSRLLVNIRRATIVLVLLLGYLYYHVIGESFALVTIGLVSFAAAAQFAPPILLGIYWRGATLRGASAGLVAGFAVWTYTLLLPSLAKSGWLPMSFVNDGPLGLELLRPYALFGLEGYDSITHAVIWSMLANTGCLVGVSLCTKQSAIEQVQAALFVDAFRRTVHADETRFFRGTATVADLHALAARFLGERRASEIFTDYQPVASELDADPQLVNRVERLMAGAIGAASARVMVSSIVKGEALSMESVMQILDETSQVMEASRRLEQKSAELQAATEELRAANARLKELDRLKDDFVSTVSHELRTPLTSIRSFSEILLDNPAMATDQRAGYLEIVVKETERLTRLVNDVLDLAKMESEQMDWRMETLDLREVLTEAKAAVSQLFSERELTLSYDESPGPHVVRGDRDRLLQVVINLLSNARKFSAPGTGRVAIRVRAGGGEVEVSVSDNGPGIPPEHLGRIFEKFHQVTDTDQGKPQGSGLGLTISERIVAHHGGRIWAESTVGQGTTISFTLPVVRDGRPRRAA